MEVFRDQLAPSRPKELNIDIFERFDDEWLKLAPNGCSTADFDPAIHQVLNKQIDPDRTNDWFYDNALDAWFCTYKPFTSKQFALYLTINDPSQLVDEEYIQLLFSFYCHQLRSLESTYRDSLTGLYNRRAFDQRIDNLFQQRKHQHKRKNQTTPAVFVMMDIDHFKHINDEYGHLYGDEVLSIVARIMTDSFREYDLLFRYGGEEFVGVLMDLDDEQCRQALERFRHNVGNFRFPKGNTVTVSIGYTDFDMKLNISKLIEQADKALYFCKHNGRNQLARFQK